MSLVRNPAPISDKLGDTLSEAELASAWRGVHERRDQRIRGRRTLRVAATAGAIGLVALGAIVVSRPAFLFGVDSEGRAATDDELAHAPITRMDGRALVALSGHETATLSDASRLEMRGDGQLEVLENRGDAIALHLIRGSTRFVITPNTGRRWTVEAAGVTVEVVGTVFQVDRTLGDVEVTVERGVVLVRGDRVPDGVRRLTAGQRLLVETDGGRSPVREVVEAVETPEGTPSATLEATSAGRAQRPTRSPDNEHTVASPSELLARADAARRGGELGPARRVLRRIVEEHPDTPEAPLAAYTLARLLGDDGRGEEARVFYERALALGLPGALAQSAREALASNDPGSNRP